MNEETNNVSIREKATDAAYWVCIIGPVEKGTLPQGADAKPRSAAIQAVIDMIDAQPECWSGWGTDQSRFEQIMEVWNAEPTAQRDEVDGLKACPFCGEPPAYRRELPLTDRKPEMVAYCETAGCPVHRIATSIESWNRRA